MKTQVVPAQFIKAQGALLGLVVSLAGVLSANAQLQITTVAGYAGSGSTDGTGSGALFLNPQGVALDAAGNTYVADTGNNTIRIISPGGVSSTYAGKPGVAGSFDATGTNALFNQPAGIALDASTNLYVCDYGNNTIRKITPGRVVTTIAGTAGVAGSANLTGTNATFFHPTGIALDSGNNLYVADYGNHLIRKISTSFTVSTYAGVAGTAGYTDSSGGTPLFNEPEGVAVDSSGIVYVADTGNAAIRKITTGSVVSTVAGSGLLGSADGTGTNALFYQPVGIAVSSSGALYVSDYFNNNLRKIVSTTVTTIAGLAGTTGSADGTSTNARFWAPQGLAVNSAGTVYVADSGNSTIRTISSANVVSTFVGSPSIGSTNGATSSSRFYNPRNVVVDAAGNVYVADTQNSVIRRITPLGVVSIFAGTTGIFGSQDGAASSALFSGPQGLAIDGSGTIYVADTGNNTIRTISGGTVSTLAGLAGNPGNADGSGTAAQFNEPKGVAVDGSQNVYVADTWNHTLRKITSGVSSTIAGLSGTAGSFDGTNTSARFNCPTGVAVDGSGNLYVTDYYNDTVRKVTSAGVVTTLAGSPGIWGSANGTSNSAQFFGPTGISIDSSNNLYVVDSGNDTLRKVTQAGVVTTLAGLADVIGSADGLGTAAQFYDPEGVTVSAAGYVYIADSGNNTVRSQPIPPVIVTQPQSQTNAIGTPITLSVAASGSTPFTYTWHNNGTNYPTSASSALVVSNAGSYTVTVSNLAGFALSSAATIGFTNAVIVGSPGVFQNITAQYNGAVHLGLSGTTNASYTLQVSTNLVTWSNLVSFTMTNGAVQFNDSTAANLPARFYRLTSP